MGGIFHRNRWQPSAGIRTQPLKVTNPGLGYDITYYIDEFRVQKDGYFSFFGNIQFEEIEVDGEKEELKIKENREFAYLGSMPHFFRSLIDNKLIQEGFTLYALSGSPLDDRNIISKELGIDTLVYIPSIVTEPEITLPEWIKVIYEREGERYDYMRLLREQTGIREKDNGQVSYLKVHSSPLSCTRAGYLIFPQLVTCYGHWAYDRLPEKLPFDYLPDAAEDEVRLLALIDSLSAQQLIRRGIGQTVKEDRIPASRFFYAGLERLEGSSPYLDTLYQDIEDILSLEERRKYKQSEKKAEYLLTVWQQRDPSPATYENERISEHWKRIGSARRKFPAATPRGYDDRGMMYVRYGAPYARLTFQPTRTLADNECWIYHRFGHEVVFDFVKHKDQFNLMTGVRGITPEGNVNPSWEQMKRFVEKRLNKSYSYRLFSSEGLASHSGFASDQRGEDDPISSEPFQKLEREYRYKVKDNWAELPQAATNLRHINDPLPSEVNIARFYRDGKTRLEVYYAVPYDAMIPLPGDSTGMQYPFRVLFAIRDDKGSIIKSDDQPAIIQRDSSGADFFKAQMMHTIYSSEYRYAVEFQNPTAGKVFEKEFLLSGFPIDSLSLFLSDIQLSDKIEAATELNRESAAVKEGLFILPFPFSKIHKDQKISFYFEVYNTRLDSAAKSNLQIKWKIHKKLAGWWNKINIFRRPEKGDFKLSTEVGESAIEQVHFSPDISMFNNGNYTMTVEVIDLFTGSKAGREIEFTVFGNE